MILALTIAGAGLLVAFGSIFFAGMLCGAAVTVWAQRQARRFRRGGMLPRPTRR